MRIRALIACGAWLLVPAIGFAQDNDSPRATEFGQGVETRQQQGIETRQEVGAAIGQDPDGLAGPKEADTAPSTERQTDIVNRPDFDDADRGAAQQTAPMPNAIDDNPQQSPTANRAEDNSWRYRWHNGRWWYWMPDNTWRIWMGDQWVTHDQFRAQASRYTGPRFRGYSDPYYSDYRRYDPRYRTGYRGDDGRFYDGRYYDGRYYDGRYYDGRFYDGRGYYGPGYDYGYGQWGRGAGVGGAIGGAIGGGRGADVGAAIGGAIEGTRR